MACKLRRPIQDCPRLNWRIGIQAPVQSQPLWGCGQNPTAQRLPPLLLPRQPHGSAASQPLGMAGNPLSAAPGSAGLFVPCSFDRRVVLVWLRGKSGVSVNQKEKKKIPNQIYLQSNKTFSPRRFSAEAALKGSIKTPKKPKTF